MVQFRVLVPDAYLPDMDLERAVAPEIEYVIFNALHAHEIPDSEWARCDGVIVWHRMKLAGDVIAKLARCRHIVRVGVGFDNVDVDACRKQGIPVSNVPNYGTTEVADHALALMLSLVRGLDSYRHRLRQDFTNGFVAEDVPVVRRIRGGVFGAIGLGRIGTAIARRVQGFDMTVIYHDPYVPEGHELGLGLKRMQTQEEVLEQADVVSIHVPLSAATRHLIGDAQIRRMKPGSILINIARGGLVDLDAVEAGLRSGHLAAVGIDVLPKEPPADPLPPLLAAWQRDEDWLRGRMIVTPHAAFYSDAGYVDMRTFSAEILRDGLTGKALRNNVNPGWEEFRHGLGNGPGR